MPTTDFKPKQRADRDVATFAEFAGLRNDTTPERFTLNDLAVADNMVLDNARTLSRRTGSTLLRTGAAHSLWASEGDAFYADGATLLRMDSALNPVTLATNLSGTPVSFARGGDNIYFSNGTDTGVALDTSTRSWGLEVPALLATPSSGDLAPGTYLVSATYVRDDGQESGAESFDPVQISAGQGVLLTIPTPADTSIVAARIYMSPPNEEVLYHVGSTSPGAPSFSPTASDIAAMNEPLATQFMGPAPAGRLVAYFKGRVFVASGAVLYPSQPYNYELFDLRDFILLDGPITMLAPFEDSGASGFFIGTESSTGVLLGDTPDDFKYVPKADVGVVRGAQTFVDGALYTDGALGARLLPMWLSRAGVCVGTPGLDIINITRERYTFATAATGAAMYDPVSNQFVATLGGGRAIAMNTQTLTLTTFSGFAHTSFARAFGRNLAAGAGLFELVGDTDNTTPIPATVTVATTDFGSSFVKVIERLYVGYRAQADMQLSVSADGEAAVPYTLPATAQPDLATQRLKVGKGLSGRYWTFTLANIAGADFALDTIDVKSNRLERRVNGRA